MATSTVTTSISYIPTNGTQPTYTAPPGLIFADTRPAQAFGQQLLVPFGSQLTLGNPNLTTITEIDVINTDTMNYLYVRLTASGGVHLVCLLPPNGGHLNLGASSVSPSGSDVTMLPSYGSANWTLQSCNSTGGAATTACSAFVYLAGV